MPQNALRFRARCRPPAPPSARPCAPAFTRSRVSGCQSGAATRLPQAAPAASDSRDHSSPCARIDTDGIRVLTSPPTRRRHARELAARPRVEESPHASAAGNPTMDVQCERCKTEYEFDDALVSGRGTTVRCTSCGHQFKVRRAAGADAAGDRWLVKTANGHQFTFLTLRELQRAILAHQVSKNDLLRRAGAPPRPLGSISELEPFFEGRATSTRAAAGRPARRGRAWARVSVRVPEAILDHLGDRSVRPRPRMRDPDGLVRPGAADARQDRHLASAARRGRRPASGGADRPATDRLGDAEPRAASAVPRGHHCGRAHRGPAGGASRAARAPRSRCRRRCPRRRGPCARRRRAANTTSPRCAARSPRRSRSPTRCGAGAASEGGSSPSSCSWRWASSAGPSPGRTSRPGTRAPPRSSIRAPRPFSTQGEKAMADGDLDQAQEAFDKASALAESEPRVRLDQAQGRDRAGRRTLAQAEAPAGDLRRRVADDRRQTRASASPARLASRTPRWRAPRMPRRRRA